MGAFYKYIDKITNSNEEKYPLDEEFVDLGNEDYEIINPNYNKSEMELLGNELNNN